jgi:hypothetical protein
MKSQIEGVPQSREDAISRALQAACLVLFPLILILIDLTKVHPGLTGRTGADQIRSLAQQAARWSEVHSAFVLAGFCALASILVLRSLIHRRQRMLVADVAAAVGVIGAVIFTGTVIMEVLVVPALSTACASTPSCVSPQNFAFTERLADQGWRVLPGLGAGAQTLMLGLLLLAVIGSLVGALKPWESALIAAGALFELVIGTGLHRWGSFYLNRGARGLAGLAGVAVLLGNASIAWRLIRRKTDPDPAEPAREPETAPTAAVPAVAPGADQTAGLAVPAGEPETGSTVAVSPVAAPADQTIGLIPPVAAPADQTAGLAEPAVPDFTTSAGES